MAALGVVTLHAQEIRVAENVRVARGPETRPLVEPHLAVHPTNPNHLLAAAIVGDTAEAFSDKQTCSSFLSIDGGRTWQRHDFQVRACADPWVAVTPRGAAVFVALGQQQDAGGRATVGLVAFHSADGGKTWNDRPSDLGASHDHPTAVVDTSAPDRADWVYVVSSRGLRADAGKLRFGVFVARSIDGGKTFDEPVTVTPSNLNQNAEVPAVLSDGALIASYVDTQRNVEGFKKGLGMLERRRAWVLRSADGGKSFSPPLFVSEACAMGWTALAAGTGVGRSGDRLYFTCKLRGASTLGVHSSGDAGETWTDATRLQMPAAARVDHPVVAVNAEGVVGLAWIESRAQPQPSCHEVHFTASLDGGRTFLPDRRVSSADSCPTAEDNGAAYSRWSRGGDYFGMVAASDGRFHVLWSDARDKVYQIWTAAVAVAVQPR
jgi:hypothetical protein